MNKIELVERDGKFFIRKKGRFLTLWWNEDWTNPGWELFRHPMEREEAEEIFAQLQKKVIDDARFAAATDKVIKTISTEPLWPVDLQAKMDEVHKMGEELKAAAKTLVS